MKGLVVLFVNLSASAFQSWIAGNIHVCLFFLRIIF